MLLMQHVSRHERSLLVKHRFPWNRVDKIFQHPKKSVIDSKCTQQLKMSVCS